MLVLSWFKTLSRLSHKAPLGHFSRTPFTPVR